MCDMYKLDDTQYYLQAKQNEDKEYSKILEEQAEQNHYMDSKDIMELQSLYEKDCLEGK